MASGVLSNHGNRCSFRFKIEQAIVSSMYSAQAEGRPPGQEDLLQEMKQTRPLSVVMAEQVSALREWAASRTVPCD